MDNTFHTISLSDFPHLLQQLALTRTITSIHLHHTYHPNAREFEGETSLKAMQRVHRELKGWTDIGQHLTVDPDGVIWLGRNWNLPPASADGHNGNPDAGPLMISVVGNFNSGEDKLTKAQRETLIDLIAHLLSWSRLPKGAVALHRHLSPKRSCPGMAVDWEKMISEAGDRKSKVGKNAGAGSGAGENREFDEKYFEFRERIEKIRKAVASTVEGPGDPSNAEHADDNMSPDEARLYTGRSTFVEPTPKQARGGGGSGDVALTPEVKQMLRRHVVSLVQGEFSSDVLLPTSADNVTAIFERHLPEALDRARQANRPLRIVFYAHGGLTSESYGLQMAAKQIPWWESNEIYPIFFIWHTGLLETIAQLIRGSRAVQAEVARAPADWSDRVIEGVARNLGPLAVWSGMKRSAERASAKRGGAYFVAQLLKTFCDANGAAVELHALGHSAGSIYHSWFLDRANSLGVPSFKSVHFLAPAVRSDVFKQKLKPLMGTGNGIDILRIYTMSQDWELEDTVVQIYRKSLLYLIYYGLESSREIPILGLEESLEADAQLRKLFAINRVSSGGGELILSVSQSSDGNRASKSKTHGGFDNDPTTMNSVTRWILQRDQIKPLPSSLTEVFDRAQREILSRTPMTAPGAQSPGRPAVTPSVVPAGPATAATGPIANGTLRALCVGINDYPSAPLFGCVADAESWASTLTGLGFEVSMLRDGEATQTEILSNLKKLIVDSRAGDVVVFQFAGHGTQLQDENGDEIGQDSAQDEALCPHDFDSGAYVIDDDMAAVFRQIPDGVSVTCFIDCCHSGTISRFAVGTPPQHRGVDLPRFMEATPKMQAAHRQFRRSMRNAQTFGNRGPDLMKEVVFSACLSREVAWESAGHGDFTTRATALLAAGIQGVSNEEFHRRVVAAFGASPRQHPYLDCPSQRKQEQLLAGHGAGGRIPDGPAPAVTTNASAVARALRAAAAAIDTPQ